MKKRIVADRLPEPPPGTFSNAIAAGGAIYVAGQTPSRPDGSVVAPGDAFAQAVAVFEKIETLLTAAGAHMDDVVKLTIYLTDMAARPQVSEARRRFFSGDFPASTLIGVAALAQPEWLVEIEAIAVP